MSKVFIESFTELPVSCKDCKIRNNSLNWVCGLVEWNHCIPIYYQKVSVSETEWYDGNWKHPDCPLRVSL